MRVPGHCPVCLRGELHLPGAPVHRDQPQHQPRDQDKGAVWCPPLHRGQAASRRGALQGIQSSVGPNYSNYSKIQILFVR